MERHIYSYQSDVTPFYYPLEYADLSWDATKVPAAALADRFDLERNYANVTISLDRMVRYLWPSGFKGLATYTTSRSQESYVLAGEPRSALPPLRA